MPKARLLVRSAVGCALALASFAPTTSWAQGSDAALAEALFQEGRRLIAQNKVAEACPKFEESHRLAPKLGTLLNLATCHDKQGKTGSAWGELTEALTLAKQAGEAERIAYARKLLDDLEKRLSRVVLEVPKTTDGEEVKLDGRVIVAAAYRTPIPVDPGDHTIEATAPGHASWTTIVAAKAGPSSVTVEVPELAVSVGASAPPPPPPAQPPPRKTPPPPPPEHHGPSGQLVAGLVIGGVGLVGLGVGSVFGVMTFGKQSDSEDHCVETRCDAEGVDLRDSASTTATVSTIAMGVGAAALVGGIVLIATDSSGDATASATLAPSFAPGYAGATFRGAFR
jgi:hypothetical protein